MRHMTRVSQREAYAEEDTCMRHMTRVSQREAYAEEDTCMRHMKRVSQRESYGSSLPSNHFGENATPSPSPAPRPEPLTPVPHSPGGILCTYIQYI
jgi:hypothetical protein